MNKIRVLDENLINQIAAGEVIERPASVLKELVENSIDAGATLISIKLQTAGRRLIEVADNGCGMSPDDALLALERHATSKIKDKADLERISTLGFRGEAIPSIGAVSRMTLTSATDESLAGCQIQIAGGKISSVKQIGAPAGTVVQVRNLFYNLPARLKFLKAQATELSHINQTLTKLALGHPRLHFKLTHQDKVLFDLPPQISLRERVAGLFGVELAAQLIEVDYREGPLHLSGLIGSPALQRSGRDYQFAFVNRRAVQNKTVSQAANSVYRGLLPDKRHPVWFLFVKIPPELLDVNVHPAKLEVRFRNHNQVYQLLESGLRRMLEKLALAPRQQWTGGVYRDERPVAVQKDIIYTKRIQKTVAGDLCQEVAPGPSKVAVSPAAYELAKEFNKLNPAPDIVALEDKGDFWRALAPIGQLHQTYLLCQNKEELVIIDQHAAHERITYERMVRELKQRRRLESQRLLFPLQMDLPPRQQPLMQDQIPFLEKLGFELAMFADKTLVIQAAPVFLANEQIIPFLKDICDQMIAQARMPDAAQAQSGLLERLACHASVRANQVLPKEQIQALLQQLSDLNVSFTCPHGRPTAIRFSVKELAKRFKRG